MKTNKLNILNNLPQAQAQAHFYYICASSVWAKAMTIARPFNNIEQLQENANKQWAKANEEDLLESFLGHGKIGDSNAFSGKFSVHANQEQGQVASAQSQVLQQLATLNNDYQQKFGFIFIVCASGKSAEQILTLLASRLSNSRQQELQIAHEQLRQIIQLRLKKEWEAK